MKNQLLRLLVCYTFVIMPRLLAAQWFPIGSPEAGDSKQIDFDGQRVFALVSGGILYSDDSCAHWQIMPAPKEILYPDRLWAENGRVFILSSYERNDEYAETKLYSTGDGGQNWQDITPFSSWAGYRKLAAVDGNNIVAARYDSLMVSTDGGQTFTGSEFYPPADLERFFMFNGVLYGAASNHLYRSDDLGQNWLEVNNTSGLVWSMYLIENDLYAIVGTAPHGRLFKSLNEGLNWTEIAVPASVGSGAPWLAGGDGKLYLYDDILQAIYYSSNNGQSWVKKPVNYLPNRIYYFGGKVLAAGGEYVRVSFDNATTFGPASNGFAQAAVSNVVSVAGQLWVAESSTPYYRLTDSGAWDTQWFSSFAASKDGFLIASRFDSIFRSNNGGLSWTHFPANSTLSRKIVALNNTFYALRPNNYLYSQDHGQTWQYLSWPEFSSHTPSLFSYGEGNYMLADYLGKILYASDGIGFSDVSYNLAGSAVTMIQATANRLFAFNSAGLWQLDLPGSVWTPANALAPAPGFPADYIPRVSTMCMIGSTLVAGVYGHGVFISEDHGNSWTLFSENLDDYQIMASFSDDYSLWVGTDGGVWRYNLIAGPEGPGMPQTTVRLFPVPASNQLFLEFDSKISGPIRVMDALGREMFVSIERRNEQAYTLQLNGLPNGLYWLFCEDKDGKPVQGKFVVAR